MDAVTIFFQFILCDYKILNAANFCVTCLFLTSISTSTAPVFAIQSDFWKLKEETPVKKSEELGVALKRYVHGQDTMIDMKRKIFP